MTGALGRRADRRGGAWWGQCRELNQEFTCYLPDCAQEEIHTEPVGVGEMKTGGEECIDGAIVMISLSVFFVGMFVLMIWNIPTKHKLQIAMRKEDEPGLLYMTVDGDSFSCFLTKSIHNRLPDQLKDKGIDNKEWEEMIAEFNAINTKACGSPCYVIHKCICSVLCAKCLCISMAWFFVCCPFCMFLECWGYEGCYCLLHYRTRLEREWFRKWNTRLLHRGIYMKPPGDEIVYDYRNCLPIAELNLFGTRWFHVSLTWSSCIADVGKSGFQ